MDKISARNQNDRSGCTGSSGNTGELEKEEAVELCNKIGYPVMLKASMGGGGKGMRLIHNAGEVEEAYHGKERIAFFIRRRYGISGEIREEPHHIEFQILGDKHGNVIHREIRFSAAIRK